MNEEEKGMKGMKGMNFIMKKKKKVGNHQHVRVTIPTVRDQLHDVRLSFSLVVTKFYLFSQFLR